MMKNSDNTQKFSVSHAVCSKSRILSPFSDLFHTALHTAWIINQKPSPKILGLGFLLKLIVVPSTCLNSEGETNTWVAVLSLRDISESCVLCDVTKGWLLELKVSVHPLRKMEQARKRKGWTFLICGRFTDRLQTHAVVRKHSLTLVTSASFGTFREAYLPLNMLHACVSCDKWHSYQWTLTFIAPTTVVVSAEL